MRTDIFFFTDVDLLNGQTPEQAFGPVSNTISQFRVVNTFTVLDKANIYAICRGKKLTYQDGTVILYPYDETIFDGLPVQYFIYTNVDVSNVVTQLIPEDESDDLLIAQQYKYSAYLESVETGAIIAETYDNTVSIAVVTTGVDDGLRAFEKCVDCVTINGGENSKRQREKILSYMDISAFYGMFVGDKIKVKKNTGEVSVYKTKEYIYNDILSKFWNRNKIYVDIRDSRYYSLNYRKNEETQHCIEVQGNISSNVEYETFPQWPLLIIEEPKDSNNADPLSLKYYEAIVQISNGRKTYCVFGYKRKGKRLKKQRLYNTTEISISFPVVNGNYVSSYYRYMVDTDVTNQEGLNGLFQVRPFEEYTRYYNSSAEVQSWLTGRLCFYKDTVVACGIALDYGMARITFFAVELKDIFDVQNLITGKLKLGEKDNQEKQSIYQYFCKAGEFLVKEFPIHEKKYKNNHLYVVSYISPKKREINIVSFTLMNIEYDKLLEKNLYDSSLIYDYELYFHEMEKQNDNKGNGYYQMKISICRDRHVVFADKIEMLYGREDISPMIFQSEQAGYSESVLNGSVDYAINQGNICFQKNDEEAYVGIETSDCKRGSIKDECDCEEEELKTALKDIKIYTPNIYNVILRMLYIGVPINYPDGHKEMFRPQILIKYSQLENNFIGTCTPVSYKKLESGLDSTSGLSCEFNNNITNYVNQCKKSILINDNKIKCINVESWNFNDFSIKVERYNNELKYKDAISKGYGLIEPSFRIELDLKERCKTQYLSECLETNKGAISIDDFSRRRYHNASVLIHEFGHVYERITNMYNDYIWNLFESYLKSYQKEHPINDSDYRNNQNTLGHIMGRPSGVCAVKWELEFTKNFFLKNHEKVFTEIENNSLSGYEKYIKYKPIKQYTGVYNIEFYRNRFCETYKYNINDENNIFLQ